MIEALFAFIVLMAALAVLFDIRGELVLIGAFFIVLWQFAQFLGPSPMFVAVVVITAAFVRILVNWLVTDRDDKRTQTVTTFVDEAITRREQDPDTHPGIWTDHDDGEDRDP